MLLISEGFGEVSGAAEFVDYFWRKDRDLMPCANKEVGTGAYARCALRAYKRCVRKRCKCFGFNTFWAYIPLFHPLLPAQSQFWPLPRFQSSSSDGDKAVEEEKK